ncbi:ubiquitin-like protein Pup [Actinomyces sp. SKVG-SVH-4(1)]|uniref:ubiquitin-like protein Pup n=1 Tax=Actinomyces sp. SKVG-SVH-4(1) TaxID=3240382 RepID=UPI003AF23EB3
MTPQHASQSHGQVRRDGVETTSADTEQQISAGKLSAGQTSEVDSILDEIDSVIETNAAAFVQGFVQKGGQ